MSSLAHGNIEIIVGLDNDDPTAVEAERLLAPIECVRIVKGDRKETFAQLVNYLADQTVGDIIQPFGDDYVMDQENWVELTERAVAKLPAGLGIAYLHDPMYQNFASFPTIPRRMLDMVGFLLPPFFPFLFGDTWWNEIGELSGCKVQSEASVTILAETGHDHRYIDLKFWAEVFEALRPMRTAVAHRIHQEFRDQIPADVYEMLVRSMPMRERRCEHFQAEWKNDEFIARLEGMGEYRRTPVYQELKAKMERVLQKVRQLGEAA